MRRLKKKESLQRTLFNVTASFRKTKKTLSNVTFICVTLQHVWKLVVSNISNMFLLKLNKTISINDI